MLRKYVPLQECHAFTQPCTASLSFRRAHMTCPKAAWGARNRPWAIVLSV